MSSRPRAQAAQLNRGALGSTRVVTEADKVRDRAYSLAFLTGALAAAVPITWIIFSAAREGAFLLMPWFEPAQLVFYALFVILAIAICHSAWRLRNDRPLVLLGSVTAIVLIVTLLAPLWWDTNAFFDHWLSIPMAVFSSYALVALAASLDWFVRRRPRVASAA